MGSVCGGLVAGIMALSLKYGRGRDELAGMEGLLKVYPHPVLQEFYRRFCEQNGSDLCREIIGINLGNDEERAKWYAAGGHDECVRRAGRTARLAAELLTSGD